MTEAEWRSAEDPKPMLEFLICRAADRKLRRAMVRKLRLCAAACARRVWPLLPGERGRSWIEIAEALADDRTVAVDVERERADYGEAFQHIDGWRQERANRVSYYSLSAAQGTIQLEAEFLGHWTRRGGGVAQLTDVPVWAARALAHLSRPDDEAEMDWAIFFRELAAFVPIVWEVFGNPFETPRFDARWRTADTAGLAVAIYEDRAFGRMPILGDALMDAGCEDQDIIAHCQGQGPHVRGCWVVDLLLGKA